MDLKVLNQLKNQFLLKISPDTSWNLEAPSEYGFYSNVNLCLSPQMEPMTEG